MKTVKDARFSGFSLFSFFYQDEKRMKLLKTGSSSGMRLPLLKDGSGRNRVINDSAVINRLRHSFVTGETLLGTVRKPSCRWRTSTGWKKLWKWRNVMRLWRVILVYKVTPYSKCMSSDESTGNFCLVKLWNYLQILDLIILRHFYNLWVLLITVWCCTINCIYCRFTLSEPRVVSLNPKVHRLQTV